MKDKKIEAPGGVLKRHLSGGAWKVRKIEKAGKGRSEQGYMGKVKCTALCPIHGHEMRKNCPKYVPAPNPKNKRERRSGGCPACHKGVK